jgi:hypothetical protein
MFWKVDLAKYIYPNKYMYIHSYIGNVRESRFDQEGSVPRNQFPHNRENDDSRNRDRSIDNRYIHTTLIHVYFLLIYFCNYIFWVVCMECGFKALLWKYI